MRISALTNVNKCLSFIHLFAYCLFVVCWCYCVLVSLNSAVRDVAHKCYNIYIQSFITLLPEAENNQSLQSKLELLELWVLPNPVKKKLWESEGNQKLSESLFIFLHLYISMFFFLLVHNSSISRYRDRPAHQSVFQAENIDMFSEERGLKKLLEDSEGFCSYRASSEISVFVLIWASDLILLKGLICCSILKITQKCDCIHIYINIHYVYKYIYTYISKVLVP